LYFDIKHTECFIRSILTGESQVYLRWRAAVRQSSIEDLPVELAFLVGYGVSDEVLKRAAKLAQASGSCPARTMIMRGLIAERLYYRCLARQVGASFCDGWPLIGVEDPERAQRIGCVSMDADRPVLLVAPEGARIAELLAPRRANYRFAITTPSHLAALIHRRAQPAIEFRASEALPQERPALSARGAAHPRALAWFVATLISFVLVLLARRPAAGVDALGLLFLTSLAFRLLVAAAGHPRVAFPPARPLADALLPVYSVLVPLRHESEIVPDLLKALAALDYPREKLQVLLLVETEDRATRRALAAETLPPWLQVVLAPRRCAAHQAPGAQYRPHGRARDVADRLRRRGSSGPLPIAPRRGAFRHRVTACRLPSGAARDRHSLAQSALAVARNRICGFV
jgi:hypothetical protein